MRILHLVHQYLPAHVGGTELYTKALAANQLAQGHRVAIFVPSTDYAAPDSIRPSWEEGLAVYRVPIGPQSRSQVFWHTFRQPQLAEAFTAVLAQEQPDLIHIQHLMGLPASIVDQIIRAEIPYAVTLHDYWYLCANAQLLTNYDQTVCQGPDWWVNCARCVLARAGHPHALAAVPALVPLLGARHHKLQRVLRQAQALIAPSAFVARLYDELGDLSQKIHVIPHGLELPIQLPAPTPDATAFDIAYIGGFSWQKGVHVLVEAFSHLPPPARLWLAGDPDADPAYTAVLRAQATTAVTFLGKLDREAIWELLARVDVVVVPSLWYESFVFVISEAFAMGVPVVASDLGVLADRVRHEEDGLLVPPGDVEALQRALARLQADPELRQKLKQGIPPVRSFADHAAEVESLYQTAVVSRAVDV